MLRVNPPFRFQARLLKKANIHVEEDLSKRTRENRAELRKFMRKVSKDQYSFYKVASILVYRAVISINFLCSITENSKAADVSNLT